MFKLVLTAALAAQAFSSNAQGVPFATSNDDTQCVAAVGGSSNRKRQLFFRNTARGHLASATCVASHLALLDGGELEDALIALGAYGDKHTRSLLILAKSGRLSRISLKDAVSMLPTEMSDEPKRQLRTLLKRRERLRAVSDRTLLAERASALRAVDAAIAETRPHAK